jgi:isochorismate synthase
MVEQAGPNFRVEELAEAAGVAVDTVRYYHRRKLLAPPRREGRVAWYGDEHLTRLRGIRSLADRGFTLAQIGELSDASPDGVLADLARANAADPDLDRANLAARADVPDFVIDLVVGAGLLVPQGSPGDERFTADAVDMLVAARTLVSEGVTIEELTALALRHATHVEDVVDDAIELFKRHSDRRGGDRAELLALLHRLVPVATGLVGQHFERTLRSRALARIGDDEGAGDSGIVVIARRLPGRIDPVALHQSSTDHHRSLWIRPERGLSIVALGAAETIEPHGDGRFAAASAARAGLEARVNRLGSRDAPAPVLVGGFSFTAGVDDRAPTWDGFPDARWILPELTVIDRPDGAWVLAAAAITGDEAATVAALDNRLDGFTAEPAAPLVTEDLPQGEISADDADYEALVAEAVAEIGTGSIDKVVLARVHEGTSVDISLVLRRLRDRYPACAVFAVAVGESTFLGASPEELVALDGREVRTVALAGTTSRGWDQTTDEGLADEMQTSPKVRAEHAFVVDDIIGRLETLGLVAESDDEPDILRLARVQHLRTPITASVERRAGGVSDMDVIRVAAVLHPTPAVAGTPTEAALDWIREQESFDRGWYAAPVGWCDLEGNGELRVALRSALVDSDGVHLFSGAGIVADSVPEDELAETGVKLRALLDVMEG